MTCGLIVQRRCCPGRVSAHRVAQRAGDLGDGGAERLQPLDEHLAEPLLQVRLRVLRRRLFGDRPRLAAVAASGSDAEKCAQVAFGRGPGHPPHLRGGDERQQAPVARLARLEPALAVADPLPRRDQQAAQRLGFGEVDEVAGAAGDGVVQQHGVVVLGAVAERRVDDVLDADVVGVPAELLAQPQQHRGGQAGHGEVVADRHRVGQPQQQALGAQGPGQRDGRGVLVGRRSGTGTTAGARGRGCGRRRCRACRSPRRPGTGRRRTRRR